MKILYRDQAIAIVAKPSGMLVHRGWANDGPVAITVARQLLGQLVWLVHRLDRGTSGALVLALDVDAARGMCGLFERGEVEKRYLALVRGVPLDRSVVDHPLAREAGGPRATAVTEVVRLGSCGRYSLVEAVPHTGRLHQVRRHLKHLSCPIIGDANYGKSEHTRIVRERYGLARLALHARTVAFAHPLTGARIMVTAQLPEDLAAPLERMGLWNIECDEATLGPDHAGLS